MRATRPRGLVTKALATVGVAAVAVLTSITLASSPAMAEDSSGTIDTTTSSTSIQKGVTAQGSDDCGDVCRRINWCSGSKAGSLDADAPYVQVDVGKGGEPKCVEKPKIKYQCCVPGSGNTANIDVTVTNPNSVKLKVRVWLDGGAPTEKWVEANGTASYKFAGISNGEHVIHSAVAVGKGTWCQFVDKKVDVKCATSPSPSPSSSKSPSPVPSVSATIAVSPGNDKPSLPVTGPSVGIVSAIGVAAIGAGSWLFLRSRRKRVEFVAQ